MAGGPGRTHKDRPAAPGRQRRDLIQGPARAADCDAGDAYMLPAIGQGLNGIAAGFDRLDKAAARIAGDGDSTNLVSNVVDLMQAKNQVRTNLAVVKSADEMVGTILDLFA